ncbi:MAG: type II toxin-antitoxin system HicA family toxin [Gemmatimonadaceae bacterium]
MNKRHRRTLEAIFTKPVPRDIRWREIESLIKTLGDVEEREGSRVALTVNGVRAVFHRPHPRPDTDRNAVRDLRDFLEEGGRQTLTKGSVTATLGNDPGIRQDPRRRR